MGISYHFLFKDTEQAVIEDGQGNIEAVQGNLCGVDDRNGVEYPKGIACGEVTIRISVEKGDMEPGDPNDPAYIPLDQMTPEQLAAWLEAHLKSLPGPRGKGFPNMFDFYVSHISKLIDQYTAQWDEEMSPGFKPEPEPTMATKAIFKDKKMSVPIGSVSPDPV